MVVVTEIVQLGEEQIVITRLTELLPTVTPTAPPPVSAPEPAALDIGYEVSLPNLDPQKTTNKAGLDLAESLFAGLTNFNHETQRAEPELASSWRISGDGRTWTFLLRDDVYWVKPIEPMNDSRTPEIYRPVDAHDLVYAFQRACSQESGVPDAFLLFVIEGCEALYTLPEPTEEDSLLLGVTAIDDRTLQISLREAGSDFLTITTLPQFRPVPRELVEEYGDEWRDAAGDIANGWQSPENIVISGPFVPLRDSIQDTQLVLLGNASWPVKSEGNIEVINLAFELDEEEMFAAWQARELDLSPLPVNEREDFLAASAEKARLLTNQTVFYLGFNFQSPVFQEAAVRRAFSAAIDRSNLVAGMFDGRALGLRHLQPPGVFGAPAVDEVGVGYSPDYAILQMDASSIRSCKLLPPVTMLVSTADLSLLQAELLRDMWVDELGCDEKLIQLEQVEFGTLLAKTQASSSDIRPDMWELAWPANYPDAHNYLSDLLHCTDGENRQARPCSEADELLHRARTTPDPEERIELYRMVESSFFNENGSFPLIPLYVRGEYTLVQGWLNFPAALSGGEQFDTYVVDQELKRLERSRG